MGAERFEPAALGKGDLCELGAFGEGVAADVRDIFTDRDLCQLVYRCKGM